ncbi:hypothetical protein V8C44DRAFT_75820 [Trichoderma aethiopicum]
MLLLLLLSFPGATCERRLPDWLGFLESRSHTLKDNCFVCGTGMICLMHMPFLPPSRSGFLGRYPSVPDIQCPPLLPLLVLLFPSATENISLHCPMIPDVVPQRRDWPALFSPRDVSNNFQPSRKVGFASHGANASHANREMAAAPT